MKHSKHQKHRTHVNSLIMSDELFAPSEGFLGGQGIFQEARVNTQQPGHGVQGWPVRYNGTFLARSHVVLLLESDVSDVEDSCENFENAENRWLSIYCWSKKIRMPFGTNVKNYNAINNAQSGIFASILILWYLIRNNNYFFCKSSDIPTIIIDRFSLKNPPWSSTPSTVAALW